MLAKTKIVMNWKAIIIAGAACGFIAVSGLQLIDNALAGETNIDILQSYLNPCSDIYVQQAGKRAVLRIDDIQAFAWRDISERMIDDARSRSIMPLLGVIPLNLKDDSRMYGYLRSVRCDVEMAIHGWDNKVSADGEAEFQNLSEEEAYDRISRGKDILEWLSREAVITFIPPNNIYSEGTAQALKRSGIIYVTSEGTAELDYHATTYDFGEHRLVSAQEVLDACAQRFKADNICIIMMHPQDFATDGNLDEEKYALYLSILDTMRQSGVTFVRFKDL